MVIILSLQNLIFLDNLLSIISIIPLDFYEKFCLKIFILIEWVNLSITRGHISSSGENYSLTISSEVNDVIMVKLIHFVCLNTCVFFKKKYGFVKITDTKNNSITKKVMLQ